MADLIRFTEHLIAGGYNCAYGISAADLTHIIYERGSNELCWWRNEG